MRIDIHNHYIPPYLIEEGRRGKAIDNVTVTKRDGREWVVHPQGYQYPLLDEFWLMEAKLKHMDGLGIDVSIMSIAPTLLFHWLEPGPARDFCQRTNDSLAEFVSHSGGRLYGMATVPLQDPQAAADELRRAAGLGLRGVQIGTTLQDTPLDDPRFDPFFATAAELHVPVTIHPYYVGLKPAYADFYMTNLVANPLETGLAATRLILSGFLDRYPDLVIVLMHGGGYMPYQIGRLDHGYKVRSETNAHIQNPPSTYLRRFYYDTITHASTPLKFLVELVGADRVVIGTDIPFDMQDLYFEDYLKTTGLDEASLKAINSENANRLYGLDQ